MIPAGNFWRGEAAGLNREKGRRVRMGCDGMADGSVRRVIFEWLGRNFSPGIFGDFPGVSLRSGT
jgi:hypothetical protein